MVKTYQRLNEEFYVENPFLDQLIRLGYKVYKQSKDNPEDTKEIIFFDSKFNPKYGQSIKLRESFREIILEQELRKAIRRINPWIEEDQVTQVVRKIIIPDAKNLLEINKEIHEILINNYSVSENRKTGAKSPTVKIIDFHSPEKNSFIAISQFKVNIPGTEKHIIPDIVVFINGIPLVIIECKSPTIADPIFEAITQLMRYSNRRGKKEGNEKLFWYNLFMVATSRQKAKYGTITAEYEHFVEWKDPYPYSLSDASPRDIATSQEVLVQGMLSKENLLDLLKTYTIFREDPKTGMKKIVARYQQFRAVKKIIQKLKEGKTSEEKGGIVWHTQGSGKSLTMMFTVREMYHNPEFHNYKIVFITDRKELEKQLNETSKSVGFTVHVAKNIEQFKGLLKTSTPDLVMGMVHKFQEKDLKKEFPTLNTSSNILVMIDEAHRTQYKLLGANLRKALPNSVKIAFTGTPIPKTEMTFGEYIDKYSIKQAVEDGVTVEIIYEGRAHVAEIKSEEELDKKFLDIFSFADIEQKKILGRYTWKAYLEHEKVIAHKAKDMINHYVSHVFPNGFKAQVVTVSRLAAIRYKQALQKALKDKIIELKGNDSNNINLEMLKKLKVEVIISGSPNDPPEYKEYIDPHKHEQIIKRFKLPFDNTNEQIFGDVGILVVQSMLITGFDAPIEQVMYLDNVLKDHNLLQAIARVNRVYENKTCGYVVDYVGVLKHLRKALAIYAKADIEEITTVVKSKAKSIDELEYTHHKIDEFFRRHKIINWRVNINECVDILADENVKHEFISLVRHFNNAMDAVLPEPVALKYVTDLKILNFIKESARNRYRDDTLSIKDTSRKIRQLVEEYLLSKGVNPKIPPTPLFDEKFLNNLKYKPPKEKAEELKFAIIEYIEKHYEEDPELYERFSERLKRLLEEYKENWEMLAHELSELRKIMKKGRRYEKSFGLDPEKEMPFLGVLKMELYGKNTSIEKIDEKSIDFLVNLSKDVIEIIKREIKAVDFWENYSKQKRLRSYILSHLIIMSKQNKDLFTKRNEIVQKLIELAYHIYGR